MSTLEAIGALITLVTGFASAYLTFKTRARSQDARDRAADRASWDQIVAEHKEISDRLKIELTEVRDEMSTLRAQVQQLERDHEDCQRRLAEFQIQITGDHTIKDLNR